MQANFFKRMRKTVFLGLIWAIFLPLAHANSTPPATPPKHEKLQAIQQYLNELGTLKARFTQKSPDGHKSTGTFYLWRPGLMRLEYDPPAQECMIADGTYLVHIRKDMDEVSSIALESTPAAILLGDRVDFDGDVDVIAFEEEKGQYHLTLARSDDPQGVQLILTFHQDPLTLIEWMMVDTEGRITRVRLDDIQRGLRLPKTLFKVEMP